MTEVKKDFHRQGLVQGFLRSVGDYGTRPALEVAGEVLSYNALFQKSASLAATLIRQQINPGSRGLTAVFASRSSTAFAGVLAALLRGHGYIPLNRAFPVDRTRSMLRRSGAQAVVVDSASEAQLDDILSGIEEEILFVLPDKDDIGPLAARWPKHRFIGAAGLEPHGRWAPVDVSSDDLAYLLFTSGSTGIPKGVMVAHRNVRHYVDFAVEYMTVGPEDRFSQTFDLTFDLSVADMFVAWERGACVCCLPENTLINPGRFIKDAALTIWFSVPSTAIFMKRLGALKPGSYPGLRMSLFCGEALPADIAASWAMAAPSSRVENFYGPTELTIACTHYPWDPVKSPREVAYGIVPIGWPFPGMRVLVVDGDLREVQPGRDGEMLMTGPQISPGYWNDPVLSGAAFVKPPGQHEIFYRTGDRVRRPEGDGPLLFLGRSDEQIKVLGHRVELGEIEAVVREESGVGGVVALGWPVTDSGAAGVEVFLQTEGIEDLDLAEKVARRLPSYMVPRRFHLLASFPLNTSGKCDRKALIDRLKKIS